MTTNKPVDLTDPTITALTIMQFATVANICRTSAYQLARSGEVPTIRLGNSLRIPASWVRTQLDIHPQPPTRP